MIDADVVNVELPEPGDMRSRLQHALAALCLRHKPSKTIEHRMLGVFLDTVTPKQYAISPKGTLLAMLMHKKKLKYRFQPPGKPLATQLPPSTKQVTAFNIGIFV